MKLLLKFPTRQRPKRFLKVLDMYISNLEDKNNYEIIVSCDTDDTTMNNEEMIKEIRKRRNCFVYFSFNKTKVEAINADIDLCNDWDIVMIISDDMFPKVYGFDNIIRKDMINNFPDDDGALWYNDGYQDRTNTISILGRKYYDRFGYIYNPIYKSFFCDNEFTEVTKNNNKFFYSQKVIIKHEHYTNGGCCEKDDLYIKNHIHWRSDRQIFKDRKLLNFK